MGCVSIIVAMAENGVVGREGALPWRLSADLKRFKQRTMGHHLIMGRKTFESLGRVLPGRTSIVLTRRPDYQPPDGVFVARNVDEALQLAADDDEIFVIGGAEIYSQLWDRADRLYVTRVHADVAGDARIDPGPWDGWRCTASVEHPADEKNEHPHADEIWERVRDEP
ncbi:MAG: dihydrofolate reductase [Pirellulales bacterium]